VIKHSIIPVSDKPALRFVAYNNKILKQKQFLLCSAKQGNITWGFSFFLQGRFIIVAFTKNFYDILDLAKKVILLLYLK